MSGDSENRILDAEDVTSITVGPLDRRALLRVCESHEALRAALATAQSWDGVVAFIDEHYPPDIFDGSSGDGPLIVVLTRALRAAEGRVEALTQALRDVLDGIDKGVSGQELSRRRYNAWSVLDAEEFNDWLYGALDKARHDWATAENTEHLIRSHEALRAALATAERERDAVRLACGQWADIAERERDRAKAVEAERDVLVREANEQNAADYQVRLELLSLNELRVLPARVAALTEALEGAANVLAWCADLAFDAACANEDTLIAWESALAGITTAARVQCEAARALLTGVPDP